MKIITTLEFEDGDLELLRKELPKDPCPTCMDHGSFCGECPEKEQYEEIVQSYRDRNILEFAQQIKTINQNTRMIEKLQKENLAYMQKINDQLQCEFYHIPVGTPD